MTITATNVDALRQGWEDVAATLAPGIDELPALLDTRLNEAVRDNHLDEPSLLAVVDEAWRIAARRIDQDQAVFFARRMQQAVYEFLLSLDAIVEPVEAPPPTDTAKPRPTGPLIGVEEVATLPRQEPVADAPPPPEATAPAEAPTTEMAPPETSAPDEPAAELTAPEYAAVPPAVEVPAAESDAEPPAAEPEAEPPAAEADVEPPAAEPEAEPPAVEAAGALEAEPQRRRFTLFRRTGAATTLDGAADTNGVPSADEPPQQAPPVPQPELEDLRAVFAEEEDDEPVATSPPFVAPKDGFHLTEFTPAPRPPAVPPAPAVEPAPPPIMRSAEPAPTRTESQEGRGWHIRNLRGRRRRESPDTAGAVPEPAADEPEEDEDELLVTQSDSRFDTDPEVLDARRQINDRLRHRRCDEAASLLQRLATEVGGREVAELALDAGDRCRALGKANAALSCYLAASRADPVLEAPLLRLADICIDDKDIDLAVSYLERVARLHRLRGDRRGALRVYRKIATVAPYRDDILNLLMHVHATGRFEDE